MSILRVLLLLSLVLLFSCSDDNSAGTISETDVGIIGHIVNDNGAPVANVQVIAYSVSDSVQGEPVDTSFTDNSGRYHFDTLVSGVYSLEGSKKIDTLTYTALVDQIDYDSAFYVDTFFDAGIDTLFAPGAVSGTVLLEGTTYYLGIDVFIPGTSFIGKSDTTGNFTISGIPKGTSYQLAYMFPGYETAFSKSFAVKENDTTILIDTTTLQFIATQTPPPPGGVTASFNAATKAVTISWDTVSHPNLGGFIVYKKDSSESAQEPSPISGSELLKGTSFVEKIANIDPDNLITYQYQVKSLDKISNASNFSQPAFCTPSLIIGAGIVGTIVDTENAPQAGATVILSKDMGALTFNAVDTLITNEKGSYAFKGISSGTYKLYAVKEITTKVHTFLSAPFVFDSTKYVSTPLDIGIDTLYNPGAIKGIVQKEGEANNMGIQVYIPGTSFNALTDSVGNYIMIGIPAGSYSVTYAATGYDTAQMHALNVHVGDTTVIDTVRLTKKIMDKPDAPVGLAIQPAEEGLILSWDGVDFPTLTGYSVYRKDASATAMEPQLVSGQAVIVDTVWTDTTLPIGKATYQYHVRSHAEGDKQSPLSGPVSFPFEKKEEIPEAVVVTSPTNNALSLDTAFSVIWTGGEKCSVYVYITKDQSFSLVEQVIEKATSPLNVEGLSYGATYYLRIDAKNSAGTTEGEVITFTTKKKTIDAPRMVFVPGGEIEDYYGRKASVSEFYMMEHEVTVEMYKEFESEYKNLKGESRPQDPVTSVSWGDALRFANWLSVREGLDSCYVVDPLKTKRTDKKDPKDEYCIWPHDTTFYDFDPSANGYRLPTGDEWQCAAAGGKGFDFATDDGTFDTSKAWLWSYETPALVKQYPPNPYQLYDMTANVWEMVWFSTGAQKEGRHNFVAPADLANEHGVKMGAGYYGYEGKHPQKVSYAQSWYNTSDYKYDCGFRLARGTIE